MQYDIPRPYLLFLGEQTSAPHAKTAFGLRDWAPDLCVGEFALPGATVSTGLPILTPAHAHARGADMASACARAAPPSTFFIRRHPEARLTNLE